MSRGFNRHFIVDMTVVVSSIFYKGLDVNQPVCEIVDEIDCTDPKGIVWSEMINHIKDGEPAIPENAGHNVWMDQPEAFNPTLKL